MNEIRILRKFFACTAVVFAIVSIAMVPAIIHAPFPRVTSNFHADPAGIFFISMGELISMMPPLIALANGVAWWAIKSSRRSARRWAKAASSLFLVYSVPFFVADILIMQYQLASAVGTIGVFLSSLMFSGLGITGLAYFTRCEALTPAPVPVRPF